MGKGRSVVWWAIVVATGGCGAWVTKDTRIHRRRLQARFASSQWDRHLRLGDNYSAG